MTSVLKRDRREDTQEEGHVKTGRDCVVGGNQALPQDHEDSTSRTHAQKTACGKMVYLCRRLPLGSNFPSFSIPLWKKSNLAFDKAKAKARVQNVCFKLKLSPSESMPPIAGLVAARPP